MGVKHAVEKGRIGGKGSYLAVVTFFGIEGARTLGSGLDLSGKEWGEVSKV